MKISDIIAIVGGLISLSFYGYLTFCLNYMEKRLVAVKTRAYLYLSTVSITLLAILLLTIAFFVEKNFIIKVFISLITIFYILLGGYLLYRNRTESKHKNIYFEYDGVTYRFLNRIDDTTISALPINIPTLDNEVYLIPLSKLDATKFYTLNKQDQLNKIVNLLKEIINLLKEK